VAAALHRPPKRYRDGELRRQPVRSPVARSSNYTQQIDEEWLRIRMVNSR